MRTCRIPKAMQCHGGSKPLTHEARSGADPDHGTAIQRMVVGSIGRVQEVFIPVRMLAVFLVGVRRRSDAEVAGVRTG